jgi:CDP-paratose 2-epimerase
MATVLVTGSAGLVGAEAVRFFSGKGYHVVGVDNDMRRQFFGDEASTAWSRARLEAEVRQYVHHSVDIRDQGAIERLFARYNRDLCLIVHTAGQPSHEWAASDPPTDFAVNALGTLTLLEATRRYCPDAVFVFTSTNKVYGDAPNRLPLVETATRWELAAKHAFWPRGIDETMSIDQTTHSLFGASKLAADIQVQEYGRYFGLKTGVFRGGCITGGGHSGAEAHGFLSYLMRCCVEGRRYTVLGYKGKQVRDNLCSADLVNMFWQFFQAPRPGEVYNAGGGRGNSCSVLEAIALCEEVCGKKLEWDYREENRRGDHVWYISDVSKFRRHYPDWECRYDLRSILKAIHRSWCERQATRAA